MEARYRTIDLEDAVANSSIMEDAAEVLEGRFYGLSGDFYAGGSKCNCHSKCKSGSHSKSKSTAMSYSTERD